MVASTDGIRGNRRKPSKQFWNWLLAVWVVVGVGAAITHGWLTVVGAVGGLIFCAVQRRNAPDKPR